MNTIKEHQSAPTNEQTISAQHVDFPDAGQAIPNLVSGRRCDENPSVIGYSPQNLARSGSRKSDTRVLRRPAALSGPRSRREKGVRMQFGPLWRPSRYVRRLRPQLSTAKKANT